MRTRYQRGQVELQKRKRGPDVWVYRFYDEQGIRRSPIIGTIEQLPTKRQAEIKADGYRLIANRDHEDRGVTMGAVIERYLVEEIPQRKSTRTHYMPWLNNYIQSTWGEKLLVEIKPFAVEQWLKGLDLAKKSKQHIRGLMSILFDCAMRWEHIALAENPMRLVRIKNCRKGSRKRLKLNPEQVKSVLANLSEPYRAMAIVAACLGLRASEIAGLQWGDFDWQNGEVFVQRSFVLAAEGDVKTVGSAKHLPLDPDLVAVLLQFKERWCVSGNSWVFVNRAHGRPYNMNHAQIDHLEPAGQAAGLGEGLGWHSFRHTYSTLLRQLHVDVKVQQTLLRHADIRTTLNIYTDSAVDDLRQANSGVVKMVLPQLAVNRT